MLLLLLDGATSALAPLPHADRNGTSATTQHDRSAQEHSHPATTVGVRVDDTDGRGPDGVVPELSPPPLVPVPLPAPPVVLPAPLPVPLLVAPPPDACCGDGDGDVPVVDTALDVRPVAVPPPAAAAAEGDCDGVVPLSWATNRLRSMRSDVLDGEKRCTCWWDNDATPRACGLAARSARTPM